MGLSLELVKVETPPCIRCKKTSFINVPRSVIEKLNEGAFIQDAWPYSSPQDREYLLTGTHPDCWEEIFSGSDCN